MNFTAVDDVGRVINPMIVEGQVHGGVAQGIGQALLESCVYDNESGQLLTGSYMDYCMPRADDLPNFKVGDARHPLHAQSAGRRRASARSAPSARRRRSSTPSSMPCSPLGVQDISMPATPHKVWQAIQSATKMAAE